VSPRRGPLARIRAPRAAAAIVLALACGGCGGSAAAPQTASGSPFAWLRPGPAPSGWHRVRAGGGAVLAYPPSWHAIGGDPGTVSAARTTATGVIVGYLNATPAIAAETLSGWSRFRVAHNVDEGNRDVRTLARGRGLRFLTGTGSCVVDQYRTSRRRYREIACLVRGTSTGWVIVAAATPGAWRAEEADLHRAVAAFRT
jgi:hypothetical protein